MSKLFSDRFKKNQDSLDSAAVRDLIQKMPPEDTRLLLDILTHHKDLRMVSTPDAQELLEKIVKGDVHTDG